MLLTLGSIQVLFSKRLCCNPMFRFPPEIENTEWLEVEGGFSCDMYCYGKK